MTLPDFITHYYEADYGPYLNLCDLDDAGVAGLVAAEREAKTAFNRFAMGPEFLQWRRAADDLLIRAYQEKFGFAPAGRPYFALLGAFDKTLTMFREGRKVELRVADFQEHELTFMYPDHAHLVTHYGADAPALFYQPPPLPGREPFWGRLYTDHELRDEFPESGIGPMIAAHQARDGWAGCYVEAHLWRRDLRAGWEDETGPGAARPG